MVSFPLGAKDYVDIEVSGRSADCWWGDHGYSWEAADQTGQQLKLHSGVGGQQLKLRPGYSDPAAESGAAYGRGALYLRGFTLVEERQLELSAEAFADGMRFQECVEEARHLLANTWALHEWGRAHEEARNAAMRQAWVAQGVAEASEGDVVAPSSPPEEGILTRVPKVENNREYQRNLRAKQKAGLTLKPRGRNGEPPAIVPVGQLQEEDAEAFLWEGWNAIYEEFIDMSGTIRHFGR
ncbi:hypothetical protein AK812_SmicGene2627 [Symbiodinium microadriaticum]|uniref:Uncharacterized protein n=1 Tax=Symbiodinium microadriaticum TaxID=2951 RepID=A0A1Q9F0Y5_SYMMI|nr:hypothetical protein AK812_SmicGene2627 [Symbiodinium microadriaticum]